DYTYTASPPRTDSRVRRTKACRGDFHKPSPRRNRSDNYPGMVFVLVDHRSRLPRPTQSALDARIRPTCLRAAPLSPKADEGNSESALLDTWASFPSYPNKPLRMGKFLLSPPERTLPD